MIRVPLGKTDLQVSPICFGTWQLSPRFWGEMSELDVVGALERAYELGVNFFDTAEAYGDGYAEKVLGRALAGWSREDVVITTKVFNHFNPDGSRYPDLSPVHIRARCELSLQRLKTDYIDVYLLHFYDQLTPLAEITTELESLRKAGKIRCYGVSNFNVGQHRAALAFGDYAVAQPPYSLLQADAENTLFPFFQANEIGVMVYSPLHKGLLTGKYTGEETFSDFRQFHPDFQGERFRELTARVQQLGEIAARYSASIYQLVLAATLCHPVIDVAITGIKKVAHIEEAVGALNVQLTRPDYFQIRKILNGPGGKIRDGKGTVK
ncbi:aldo/keto reductase [bacterium]|nr:aldo/keto reductase [bacterium]